MINLRPGIQVSRCCELGTQIKTQVWFKIIRIQNRSACDSNRCSMHSWSLEINQRSPYKLIRLIILADWKRGWPRADHARLVADLATWFTCVSVTDQDYDPSTSLCIGGRDVCTSYYVQYRFRSDGAVPVWVVVKIPSLTPHRGRTGDLQSSYRSLIKVLDLDVVVPPPHP